MSQSTCRTCGAPIEWIDTDEGRRPINPDGTRHRDSRSNAQPSSAGQTSPLSIRLACLDYAAQWSQVREGIKSADVVRIAAAWAHWVETGGTANA